MGVVDITGPIREGMWNYEAPFPRFSMRPLGKVPWVDSEVYCEIFEGIHSQTGTYLETPAHYYGNDNCYLVYDIPVSKLVNIPCVVLMLDESAFSISAGSRPITVEMLQNAEGSGCITEGCALLVGTGWGKHWMDENYLGNSPYFTHEAMSWLISRKPFLLGSDFPRWDNISKSEGFFGEFYSADILMLAPCVNLEKVRGSKVKLTALPLNIPGTSSIPCRAVIVDGGEGLW